MKSVKRGFSSELNWTESDWKEQQKHSPNENKWSLKVKIIDCKLNKLSASIAFVSVVGLSVGLLFYISLLRERALDYGGFGFFWWTVAIRTYWEANFEFSRLSQQPKKPTKCLTVSAAMKTKLSVCLSVTSVHETLQVYYLTTPIEKSPTTATSSINLWIQSCLFVFVVLSLSLNSIKYRTCLNRSKVSTFLSITIVIVKERSKEI